jgi:hypothetical protein
VPMFLRDGAINPVLNEVQRAVVGMRQRDTATFDAASHKPGFRHASGTNDSLHQPGFRYGVTNDATERAYADADRAMNDAWRSKAPASADASNAWKKGGEREIGMSLDSASITDARERAHEDYQNYISNAWRAGR